MNAILSSGTNLIIFIVMLGLLVFVHEFGHFIVAKRLHIPVLEFGFGFPPRIKRFMKRGETEYTINAIPLGGFVRLMGEEDPNVPGGFASAKPAIRAPILLAGVVMNFLLAYVAFSISAFASPPYAIVQTTRLAAVAPGQPITIRWDPLSGGTAADWVFISIWSDQGDENYTSPLYGEPGALNGTSTSFTLPYLLALPFSTTPMLVTLLLLSSSAWSQPLNQSAAKFS